MDDANFQIVDMMSDLWTTGKDCAELEAPKVIFVCIVNIFLVMEVMSAKKYSWASWSGKGGLEGML